MKKLIVFIFFCCFTGIIAAQKFSTYEYTGNDSVFNNPERGFYKYTERNNSTGTLDVGTLISYRENGYTLIYRIFYLYGFANSPISQAYLDKIKEDFSKIREAGIKAIVRFAYTSSMVAPYGDATPEQVSSHIAQLKPILTDNSDVIFVLQAGFIGAWGEWYYTDHFATGSPNNVTSGDLQERKALVESLLDALPKDRMIQLRYVGYKMSLFDSIPVTPEEAYSGSPKSRISHHNDCFVSSDNDVGSYRNIKKEKKYLEQDSKYTSIGGETCKWFPFRSNCDTSVSEMERFHWTFINQDYYGQTIDEWRKNGCYNEMMKKLGYRYTMVNAGIQDSSRQNGSFSIKFKIRNDGYSNPINPRNIEIVLKNKATGQLFYSRINSEIRKQELNTAFELSTQVGIPSFMPDGDYDVYLNLPDPKFTLRFNPNYSIRLANDYTWDRSLGMNRFLHTLHVDANASGDEFSGTNYFLPYSDNYNHNIPQPKIYLTSFCQSAIVSFAPKIQDPGSLIIIERSTGMTDNYSTIASISGLSETIYFKDNGLAKNTNYHYRSYRLTNDERSAYSAIESILSGDCRYKYPIITADADEGDWNAIVPSAAISVENKDYFLKVHSSNNHLNVIISGDSIANFSFYADTDNNNNTGENNPVWSTSGFEFMCTKDGLYKFESGSYSQISDIDSIAINQHTVEFKIPLELLEIDDSRKLNCGAVIYLKNKELYIPYEDKESFLYEWIPVPVKPQNFDVRNSSVTPSDRLIATWNKCNDCDGYVLTRTDKSNDEETVFDLPVNDNQLIDSPLKEANAYEYSVYSYNFRGRSEIAGPVVLSTTSTGTDEGISVDKDFILWPNPSGNEVYIKLNFNYDKPISVKIYTSDGKLLLDTEIRTNRNSTGQPFPINISVLPGGFYIIQVQIENAFINKKLIKHFSEL